MSSGHLFLSKIQLSQFPSGVGRVQDHPSLSAAPIRLQLLVKLQCSAVEPFWWNQDNQWLIISLSLHRQSGWKILQLEEFMLVLVQFDKHNWHICKTNQGERFFNWQSKRDCLSADLCRFHLCNGPSKLFTHTTDWPVPQTSTWNEIETKRNMYEYKRK